MPLTDAAIRSAKPREKFYKLADGQGMYLEVMPTGAKYWRLKYRIDGKEKRMALGVYPAVSLLRARKARDGVKDNLRAGLDPSHEKRRAKLERSLERTNSFEAIARVAREQKGIVERWARNPGAEATRAGAVSITRRAADPGDHGTRAARRDPEDRKPRRA